MKITKFVHSCLLVEMPAPVNRTALFDPGTMSETALDIDSLEFLDDIIITHGHPDHISMELVKKLSAKFPKVRITTTPEVVSQLAAEGISATDQPSEGIAFFDAPHEEVEPVFPLPQQIGVHYLDLLTDPGDSHSFHETKKVLVLPITAPWGSSIKAVNLAIELKPDYVLPVHDWHWHDAARAQAYDMYQKLLAKHDIEFIKVETGKAVALEV